MSKTSHFPDNRTVEEKLESKSYALAHAFHAHCNKIKIIKELKLKTEIVKDFNPDTDAIVPKVKIEELTLKADTMNTFSAIQKDMAKQVQDLHNIQTGKLYNSGTRKLTKKQTEELRMEELHKAAHIRAINKNII